MEVPILTPLHSTIFPPNYHNVAFTGLDSQLLPRDTSQNSQVTLVLLWSLVNEVRSQAVWATVSDAVAACSLAQLVDKVGESLRLNQLQDEVTNRHVWKISVWVEEIHLRVVQNRQLPGIHPADEALELAGASVVDGAIDVEGRGLEVVVVANMLL